MRFAFLFIDIDLRNFHYVFSLRALWPVCDLKFDLLALDKGLITIPTDRAIVNENILFAGLFDKSVALCVVKPFHFADSF